MFGFHSLSETPLSSLLIAGQTQVGSVSINGSGTLSANGTSKVVGITSLSASGSLSSSGTSKVIGAASLSSGSSLSSNGTFKVTGITSLSSDSSFSSSGTSKVTGTTSLSASSSLSSIGTSKVIGITSLSASSSLSSNGTSKVIVATSLSASSSLSSNGTSKVIGAASLSSGSSLSSSGTDKISGVVLTTGPASVTVDDTLKVSGVASLSGAASLAPNGISSSVSLGATSLSGSGSSTNNGTLKVSASTSYSASSSMVCSVVLDTNGICSLSGSSSLISDGIAIEKDYNGRFLFRIKPKLEAKPSLPIVSKGYVLADSIIAAWPFYERYSSTVRDTSGHRRDLSFNNMDTSSDWEVSEKGLGVTIDGNSEYLSSDDIELDGAFSVSFWMNVPAIKNQWRAIIGLTDNISSFYISKYSDALYLEGAGAGWGDKAFNDSTSRIQFGSWQHIVLTRDFNNTIRVYVDGIKDSNEPTKSGTLYFRGLGKPGTYNGEYLDATLTNTILFNKELTLRLTVSP